VTGILHRAISEIHTKNGSEKSAGMKARARISLKPTIAPGVFIVVFRALRDLVGET
jgi:hypothetical protein